jgi:hypothetical protein
MGDVLVAGWLVAQAPRLSPSLIPPGGGQGDRGMWVTSGFMTQTGGYRPWSGGWRANTGQRAGR